MKVTQLLAELHGCGSALENETALVELLEDSVAAVGATIIEKARVRYAPHGITVAVFLAESHAVLTTWPEYRLALLDVLLCNDQMDPTLFRDRAAALLEPEHPVTSQLVVRTILPRPDPS